MMRNTKKAFTLVELIVVITILAILGTIAFISLQGYSGEAKNSKVTSDLRNIASAIETASTRNSVTLAQVVRGNLIANNWVTGTLTVWETFVPLVWSGASYAVGNVDFAAIGQNGEDFIDPNSGTPARDYLFGMVVSPEFKSYQLAGQVIENDVKKARITGTFFTASGATATWLISAANIAWSGSVTPLKDGANIWALPADSLY